MENNDSVGFIVAAGLIGIAGCFAGNWIYDNYITKKTAAVTPLPTPTPPPVLATVKPFGFNDGENSILYDFFYAYYDDKDTPTFLSATSELSKAGYGIQLTTPKNDTNPYTIILNSTGAKIPFPDSYLFESEPETTASTPTQSTNADGTFTETYSDGSSIVYSSDATILSYDNGMASTAVANSVQMANMTGATITATLDGGAYYSYDDDADGVWSSYQGTPIASQGTVTANGNIATNSAYAAAQQQAASQGGVWAAAS